MIQVRYFICGLGVSCGLQMGCCGNFFAIVQNFLKGPSYDRSNLQSMVAVDEQKEALRKSFLDGGIFASRLLAERFALLVDTESGGTNPLVTDLYTIMQPWITGEGGRGDATSNVCSWSLYARSIAPVLRCLYRYRMMSTSCSLVYSSLSVLLGYHSYLVRVGVCLSMIAIVCAYGNEYYMRYHDTSRRMAYQYDRLRIEQMVLGSFLEHTNHTQHCLLMGMQSTLTEYRERFSRIDSALDRLKDELSVSTGLIRADITKVHACIDELRGELSRESSMQAGFRITAGMQLQQIIDTLGSAKL